MSLKQRILLTSKQAAEIVGFSHRTLSKRRYLGLPPAYLKVGHKVFYDRQKLDDFLESCIRTRTKDTSN